jgi:actin-related protein
MSAEGSGPEGGSLLLNQPVVIDNGTASIKAGFAGSSKPKVRTERTESTATKRPRDVAMPKDQDPVSVQLQTPLFLLY